jgi:hypothetical protein
MRNLQRLVVCLVSVAIGVGGVAVESSAAAKTCKTVKGKRVCTTVKAKKSTTKVAPTAAKTSTTLAPSTTLVATTLPATSTTSTTSPVTTTPKSPAEMLADDTRTRFANALVTTVSGTFNCGGAPGVVRGSGLNVTAIGCQPLLIDGSSNTVDIDVLVPGLGILGNGNAVTFGSGATNGITIVGNSNSVRPR